MFVARVDLPLAHVPQLNLCFAYSNNTASLRMAAYARIYCSATCHTCNRYVANVPCTAADNNARTKSVFGLNCTQMAAV